MRVRGGGRNGGGRVRRADDTVARSPRSALVGTDPRHDRPANRPVNHPEVTAALAEVNQKNIRRIDSTLVSFGTRNTFSDTTSATHGIGAARRWIYSEFQRYSQACGGCLRVEYNEKVQMVGRNNPIQANIVDVLAWLPGRDTSRVVVMSGHYDSCVCGNPNGTNDSTSTAWIHSRRSG
jgi:hypothetical protein